ncbi:hypothetical protein [Burkholderia sp. Ax-1719]|uniref:hypothetical protein n=1 Tax=Burkholderia sp. Ax-1719 TaxID=2608334 RepID=UPI0014214B4D|nr:hypothetical protein [Burkholderia sp. Ax-1719]NIE63175.1 hypothetical protein [Burkholderia sp. Ax-1719]
MKRPLIVYLDSSDFSTLSDVARQTPEILAIRETLLEQSRSGKVVFAFSGVHLSEMSPMGATFTPSAVGRTNLLVELCQRNAFISIDRLLDAEIARLYKSDSGFICPLTTDATWFPELTGFMTPVNWAETVRTMLTSVQDQAVNRAQRRKLQRKLGNGAPSSKFHRLMSTSSHEALTAIMQQYPMRREDALTLQAYIHGTASAEAAEAAFLASLRDPSWIMKWFAEHHDELSPVMQWLRSASAELVAKMGDIVKFAEKQRQLHPEVVGEFLKQKWWKGEQDKLLTNLAVRLAGVSREAHSFSADDVDLKCPGLACMTRTLHSVLWDAVATTPRSLKHSDAVDAMHAIYAPYCDLFRADRYMAPHIQRQVNRLGVRVVSRLSEIPPLINEHIQSATAG